MEDNTIIVGGATQPSTIDTPNGKRDRVNTFDEIFSLENPAVGATVWVRDEEREYRILSLQPKNIGGFEVENAAVKEVVPESEIISRTLDVQSIAENIVNSEDAMNSISDALAKKSTYDESTGTLVLL